MTQNELALVLKKHKLWLNGKDGGECADLRGADLQRADLQRADLEGADLEGANLEGADLQCAKLQDANLQDANLEGADLEGANLDYSCLPLWCGSLKAHFDDKQVVQFLYHTLAAVQNSKNVSDELKCALLNDTNITVANKFHRVNECGKIEVYKGGQAK